MPVPEQPGMKLAINYSSQSAELLVKGQIEIDIFKTPDWPWMITEAQGYRPVAVHFNLTAGDGKLAQADWDTISRIKETTNTPFLNLHLETRLDDFPELPVNTIDPLHFEMVFTQALADIKIALKYFSPEQVIIENVPYRGQGGKVLRPCVEPVMISRLLDVTGCGLLFDISHARIAAYYMDTRIEEYFAQMPLSKTRELHFTGMKWLQGKLTDHVECLEADWQMLGWTFSLIKDGIIAHPWMMAFEYGGVGEKFAWRSDPQVIASHVPKLSAMIRTVC
jgi:uncharacterized protein (UPF0276 family)